MPARNGKQARRPRARRGRGEGSFFERSPGKWVGSCSLGSRVGADGRPKRKRATVYGRTKDEVVEKLRAVQAAARVGNLPDAGNLTVGQYLGRWLTTDATKSADRTHEERVRLVNKHLTPRIGGKKLAKLTPFDVSALYGEMAADGVKPFALRDAAVVLNVALNEAVELTLIPANPAAGVDKPRAVKKEMQFLDAGQTARLLAAAAPTACHPLVAAALGTGARQGELLGLFWDDVDLKAGKLSVRRSLSQTKKGFVLKEPKTEASRRTLVLPKFAADALTAHRAAAAKAGLLAAPVFCTRTGNHLHKRNVLRSLRSVVKRASGAAAPDATAAASAAAGDGPRPIPEKLKFHSLRHTVASLLLSTGHSLRAVSQRLGHSNPAMTLRVYAHCMPTDDAKLAAGLDAVVSNG